MSLFWRIFLLNAAVLTAATIALLLGPATVSTPVVVTEAVVLGAGLAAMLVANAALLRVGLAPLRRLTKAMTTIDLLAPQPRPAVSGRTGIADLIATFNTMLDRLEAERATSTARALHAQEAERRRIAQELHDEIGQTLTAVMLELAQAARHAPPPLSTQLTQLQENTRASLDEIRRIARRLRPGVLEELGLITALKSLISEVAGPTSLSVRPDLARDLPPLSDDTELVIYRVAQEALTNIVRHAHATTASVTLAHSAGLLRLRVRDNGKGAGKIVEGAGIRGMRERALLIGATLTVTSADEGTQVDLVIPHHQTDST